MKYKYYFLPLDFYGQPAGWVEEAYLTEEEAAELRAVNPYVFRVTPQLLRAISI